MSAHKAYLGDAVYADFDGWHIVLTTEDGIRATNRVVLAPDVLARLIDYNHSLRSPKRQHSRTGEDHG